MHLCVQVNEGVVVAVGPGRRSKDGDLIACSVKEGDKVMLPEYGGSLVKLGEKECVRAAHNCMYACIHAFTHALCCSVGFLRAPCMQVQSTAAAGFCGYSMHHAPQGHALHSNILPGSGIHPSMHPAECMQGLCGLSMLAGWLHRGGSLTPPLAWFLCMQGLAVPAACMRSAALLLVS